MSPQTQAESNTTSIRNQHSTQPRRRTGLGTVLSLLLLLTLVSAIFEYFGILNLISGFGRLGKPSIELGIWQPARFTDVSETFWARPYIKDLSRRGIVRGFPDRTFQPNQPVNRAEFAAMLQAAFNQNPTPRIARSLQVFVDAESTALTGGFRDVPPDFWAGSAIADMTEAGFFSGFPDDEFRPNQPVSRANAIAAIANGLDLETATRDFLWFYRDATQIPEYAKDAIAAATEAGVRLYQSEPPLLQPNQNLTRAEATVLIYQALEQSQ
jgi:hypothetical protein